MTCPSTLRLIRSLCPFTNAKRGVGLERIRDLAYAFVYVALVFLFTQLPPIFYPSLIGGGLIVVFCYLNDRKRDLEMSLGLTVAVIGIFVFVCSAILVVTGTFSGVAS